MLRDQLSDRMCKVTAFNLIVNVNLKTSKKLVDFKPHISGIDFFVSFSGLQHRTK